MSDFPASTATPAPQDEAVPDAPPAVDPAEVDGVEGATVTVDVAGNTYTMPADLDDLAGDIIEAIDERKVSIAVRHLLGPEQWAMFKAGKPKARDYNAALEGWAAAVGMGSSGNS